VLQERRGYRGTLWERECRPGMKDKCNKKGERELNKMKPRRHLGGAKGWETGGSVKLSGLKKKDRKGGRKVRNNRLGRGIR